MPDALAVSDLRAGYDRSVVLQGVSLTVPTGRNVAIVGPNGAGKSTFLKVMSGIVRPSGGTILVNGGDASNWSSERTVANGIIHVPEGRQVFPGLSVAENLWLGGYSKPDRREELLEGLVAVAGPRRGAEAVLDEHDQRTPRRCSMAKRWIRAKP